MSTQPVKTIELLGQVDEYHQLSAQVPADIRPGPVKLALVPPDQSGGDLGEDDAGASWFLGVSRQWAGELGDSREDIYTLTDGEPPDEAR